MSHQDVCTQVPAEPVKAWIERFVHGSILKQFQFRKTARWSTVQLATTAVLWGLGEAATLTDRFAFAAAVSRRCGDRAECQGISYQAFLKLLVRWTPLLVLPLLQECRRRMAGLNAFTHDCGFVLLGIDGTRLAMPRSRANEMAFAAGLNPACRRRGRHRRRARMQAEIPSLWLTLVWHMGSGLPWLWRVGKANASERDHLRQMISSLPDRSLLVADAGYAGYEYWKQLLDSGVHLIIRVGSGLSLRKNLGHWERAPDRVWLWPDHAARRSLPPLKLRLVSLRGRGKTVWLVTSVLSHTRLSDAQIGEIYRRRWGVEVFFRDFKQTLQRRQLLSRTPEHVLLELHWSLLGLTLALLQAKQEQQSSSGPVRTSVAGVLRVLRKIVSDSYESLQQVRRALREAVIDQYVRRRKTRKEHPRKRAYKPPGKPQLRNAPAWLNTLAENIAPSSLRSYG